MFALIAVLLLCGWAVVGAADRQPLPIVLWHGMGDTCCNPLSIGGVKAALQTQYNVPVFSISTGSGNQATDFISGFYGNVNDEVARVCAQLRANKELKRGFTLVGFSQGGQFARAVVQRCVHEGVRVRSLLSFGGQQQGVVNVPGCQITADADGNTTPVGTICQLLMSGVGKLVYLPGIKDNVIQAQYFRAPYRVQVYLHSNPFLPDLNNERPGHVKEQYKQNLLTLDNFALIRFQSDITVVPRDTAWFSLYDGKRLVPLQEQEQLWQEDRLGLHELHDSGRLHFEQLPGSHMQFSLEELYRLLDKYMAYELPELGAGQAVEIQVAHEDHGKDDMAGQTDTEIAA